MSCTETGKHAATPTAELLEITPKTIHYKISGNFPHNGYKAHFKVNEIMQIIHYLGFKLYLVREDEVK